MLKEIEIRRAKDEDGEGYTPVFRGLFEPGSRLQLSTDIPPEMTEILQALLDSTNVDGTHTVRVGDSTYQTSWHDAHSA